MNHHEILSTSEISQRIDEWVHRERDRVICRRRWLDGICYEPLAEEMGMSVSQIKRIIYKNEKYIFK